VLARVKSEFVPVSGDCENYKGPIGVEGHIDGEIDVLIEAKRVLRFRAYAEGQAWGANSNTWHQPPGRFPLVIAIIEADDRVSRVLGPVWAGYGADYRTPELPAGK